MISLPTGLDVVDAHVHVFDRPDRSPRGVSELVPAHRTAPVEQLVGEMDAIGVTAAVLVPLDENDDYVAAAVAQHPTRFAGIEVLPSEVTATDTLATVRSRRDEYPFVGLRTKWIADDATAVHQSVMWPLLRWCAEIGIALWSYVPIEQWGSLEAVAAALPDLRILLNHYGFAPHDMKVDEHGRPWFADPYPYDQRERVLDLAVHKNVHVALSGHYTISSQTTGWSDLREPTSKLLDAFGADRLVWGSDMPWPERTPGYAEMLNGAVALLEGASAHELAMIFGGTARRLVTVP